MARYDKCILDQRKKCDDCGECDKCDLNPNKICDNCGKCLKLEDYDTKKIEIDDIISEEGEGREEEKDYDFDRQQEQDINANEKEDPSPFKLIDDVKGLGEIFEDDKKRADEFEEVYPGLYRVKPKDSGK